MNWLLRAAGSIALSLLLSATASAGAVEDWQAAYDAEMAGDLDIAIYHYSRAIRSGELPQRELARVFRGRGNTHYATGDKHEALNDFETAIRIDPTYAAALVSRGVIRHEAANYEAAIADYDAALGEDPDYALAHANRGNALAALGYVEDAIRDLRKAYALGYRVPWLVETLEGLDALPEENR
jgi:tetratricopeptide (TPR) repeat protein